MSVAVGCSFGATFSSDVHQDERRTRELVQTGSGGPAFNPARPQPLSQGEGLHGDHRYRRFRNDVSTHFFPKRFSSKSLFAKIKKFFRSVRIVKIKVLLILASFEKFCLAFTVRSKVFFPALVKPELVLQCLVIFLVNYRGMKSFRFSGCIHVLK